MIKRDRVNSMLAYAVAVFAIFFVLQKVFQVQEPGANLVIWWIVALGKVAGIVGIIVFGVWALKLKFFAGEQVDG